MAFALCGQQVVVKAAAPKAPRRVQTVAVAAPHGKVSAVRTRVRPPAGRAAPRRAALRAGRGAAARQLRAVCALRARRRSPQAQPLTETLLPTQAIGARATRVAAARRNVVVFSAATDEIIEKMKTLTVRVASRRRGRAPVPEAQT